MFGGTMEEEWGIHTYIDFITTCWENNGIGI